jgi:hypothetical protein
MTFLAEDAAALHPLVGAEIAEAVLIGRLHRHDEDVHLPVFRAAFVVGLEQQ